MKRVSIKYIVVCLLLIEVIMVFLTYKSFFYRNIVATNEIQEVNKKMFAMYTEQDDGSYTEYTDSNYFPSNGYKINLDKSNCVDNKGNSIEEVITSNSNKITVSSNKTTYCYLYFDIDKSVYAKVVRDYTNSNGALLLSETESDEYPVYYYSGNITNNNILYANFCWKMVRTTETGGVKLIYNGVPDEAEDGTLTCDNTGEESQIGTSKFNSSEESLAYVGYMYNEVYLSGSKGSTMTWVIGNINNPEEYYYADTATWNATTQKYELSNSDGTIVSTYIWADSYADLVGYYTCRSTTETECSSVYYITATSSATIYHYVLSDGKAKDDYKIKLAISVTDNGDGTYTLDDPVEISRADWYTSYSNYKNYYYCSDLTSDTCGMNDIVMYYAASTDVRRLFGYAVSNVFKYGNSVKYDNGVYKLIDTKEFWNWPENYNTLNSHHYTCFNTSGECESVNYIYYTDSWSAYYITLSGSEVIDDAINNMLYADDVNTTDSAIKDYIDTWYENNIVDVIDSNSKLYSSYLENTIWCNNREISSLNGWDPNGGDTTKYLYFNNDFYVCKNKTDQFTLKLEAGGTEGYGNNELDYPIGLLTYKEASDSKPVGGGYLTTGRTYWLLSPSALYNYTYIFRVSSSGGLLYSRIISQMDVRPAVSLANKVEIFAGTGEVDNPYQIELSS